MAIFKMDNYTEFNVNDGKVGPGMQNAGESIVFDEYTLLAELAVNDELLLPEIPEGAVLLNAKVKIPATLGASGILDMGLKAHVDRDGNAVAEDQDSLIQQADGGGQAVLDESGIGAVGIGTKIGLGGAQPFLKCTEVSTAGTGIKIQAWVEYSIA